MKCPKCNERLLKFPVELDGEKKEVFVHPENKLKKCEYQGLDGVKISIEVIDTLLCNKFQELIKEEGIKENSNRVTDSNIEKKFNVAPKIYKESNISILKHRLAKGEIDIHTFDTIKAIVEDK